MPVLYATDKRLLSRLSQIEGKERPLRAGGAMSAGASSGRRGRGGAGLGGAGLEATAGGYAEIGPNKPLTIQIRRIYTGAQPKSDWLGMGDRDLLVTSGLKSITDYAAQVRAVNLVRDDVKKKSYVDKFAAFDEGTPLVCYIPAATQDVMAVTVELTFDNFPDEVFKALGGALTAAAGIPIFATASGFLAGGGIAMGVLASLGRALFDGKPVFRETETITLFDPGQKQTTAGMVMLVAEQDRDAIESQCRLDETGTLLWKGSEKKYDGDAMYVSLSLDGHERKNFEQFTPTKIAAELIDRFALRQGSSLPAALDAMLDSARAWNDLSFRRKADQLFAQLPADKASPEYADALARWSALVKNIQNQEMKPKG